MKTLAIFFLFLSISSISAQDNLTDATIWRVGTTEGIIGFNQWGYGGENVIESLENPYGVEAPIWTIKPYADSSSPSWCGFNTNDFTDADIDINVDYRFSIWVKIINDQGARFISLLRGTGSPVYEFKNFDNTASQRDNHFRSGGNVPKANEWILMIGYIYGANSVDTRNDSGFYSAQGNGIGADWPLGSTAMRFNDTMPTSFTLINNMYNRTNSSSSEAGNEQNLLFFDPRFEKADGASSITELIDNSPSDSIDFWSSNENGINYNGGNVGIGNDAPDATLAVSGRIHAQEVKVTASVPAPDYVFYKDYDLLSLEEIQLYIKEHGHLPNIPSAKEIESKGIELGLMNMKLLEKIEELTLYILEQDKKQKYQNNKQQQLEQRIQQLENQK